MCHVGFVQMPQWEETVEECTERFLSLVKTLADKYPSENLLLVTHSKQDILGYVDLVYTLLT